MCGEAYLIATEIVTDEIGNQLEREEKNHILTFEKSINRTEWRDAGRRGLNPAILLVTPRCNYNGEKLVEYCGKRYGIYRTYTAGEDIELYLEFRDGAQA